jgi:septum formation protein
MSENFVYLASASPRRSELLRQVGIDFEVCAADVDERRLPAESPADYVVRLARAKADRVWTSVAVATGRGPVIAADTAVVVDGAILGKPADAGAAFEMLTTLSGRAHDVLTAVAVRGSAGAESALSRSEVRFRATTPMERRAYCASGEPLDKAGGYGIQGLGAVFVEHLSGSYSAVMGLPLLEAVALLKRFGIPSWLEGEPAHR